LHKPDDVVKPKSLVIDIMYFNYHHRVGEPKSNFLMRNAKDN